MRFKSFTAVVFIVLATKTYAQTPRFSELECVANAQSISLDYGLQEVNKQITLNYSRGLAMDFHRWLVAEASKITSQRELNKYHLRVSDYQLDNYDRRMARIGYCMSWYVMD